MTQPTSSLVKALAPFAGKNYETLFTDRGGYLVWKEREQSWAVTRSAPASLPGYYQDLVGRLIAAKHEYRKLPKLDAFVTRFNLCRTLSTFTAPPSLKEGEKAIHFNSKSKEHAYLSN